MIAYLAFSSLLVLITAVLGAKFILQYGWLTYSKIKNGSMSYDYDAALRQLISKTDNLLLLSIPVLLNGYFFI